MQLDIITPTKQLYSDEIKLVKLPGTKGSFEILKNHAPIVSSLEEGEVKIVTANNETIFCKITGGLVECKSNKVIVLADSGELV